MKVLQINAVNKIASTGRTMQEMSDFLNVNGHSCISVYSKGLSVNPSNEFVIGNNYDVKIHGLLSRIFGTQGYFSSGSTRKMLKYMDNYQPDVVVVRNLHGNFINLPMLLKYLANNDIATVAVLHDCWFYTGKCCHYTVDGCYKWQDSCGNCPSLKKYNKSWFFDKTSSMLEDKKRLFGAIPRLAVVGVSDWLTNEAKKAPVFENATEITRIYNWIDLEKFHPVDGSDIKKSFNIENKKIVLFVASGWSNEKGLQTVLDLSEKLNDNEIIVMVGNVDPNVVLNDKIIQVATTNSIDELVKYYSMADVFVQPSLEETFGKVSAEALACGTPVVCFNSTANPELVGEDCGEVVPVGEIDEMISAIRRVLSNGKQFYSKNCRDFAKENFDKNKNLEKYIDLFTVLISQ